MKDATKKTSYSVSVVDDLEIQTERDHEVAAERTRRGWISAYFEILYNPRYAVR